MNRTDLKEYRYNKLWIESKIEYLEEMKENINRLTSTISSIPIRKETNK